MNGEDTAVEAQDPELEGLLRDALRLSTPEGLNAAQRAAIDAESRALRGARGLMWPRATLVAAACLLCVGVFVGARLQEQARIAREEQLRSQKLAENARREAERRASEAAAARVAAEKRRLEEEKSAAEAKAASACALSAREPEATSTRSRNVADVARRASSRPKRTGASKASSGGGSGCDPNDPMCGL